MKNRVLKLFSILALIVILLIPSTAKAVSISHSATSIYTNTYLAPGDTILKRVYYFGPTVTYPGSGSQGLYKTFFHQVTEGNNIYLAYCLDPNGKTINASGSILSSTNTTLKDARGNNVTGDRLQLLKNILAAGQQLDGYSNVTNFINKTSNKTKKNYLATQILIWEVMSGGRTDYKVNNLSKDNLVMKQF